MIIIPFMCLFLFSTPSFALIPGDFNGDGQVQFEDLMIFALAYGSTPSDANWNPVCDIASAGGVLSPDGVIDFEDLMIFALHYGECEDWVVICRTETISPNPYFMPPPVRILWTDYPNANDYQVYKSTDGNNFTLLEGEYELLEYEWLGRGDWYDFWDHETIKGNTYYYYVKAFDGATELQTSSTMTVDTWLPGIIAIDPIEDEVVTDPTPTFMWQYENSISFPYGPFDFSRAAMVLYDTDSWDLVWEIELNNLDIFSYTYDGPSLIEGRRYIWTRLIDGEGDGISTSTASMGTFFYVESL